MYIQFIIDKTILIVNNLCEIFAHKMLFSGSNIAMSDVGPNKLENSYPSSGKGSIATEQGQITIRGVFDANQIERTRNKSSGRRPVYGDTHNEECFDIVKQELVFSHNTSKKSSTSEDVNSMLVMSSLNGMGVEAQEGFPNDPRIQRLRVMQDIKFVGVARDTITMENKSQKKSLAVQIGGVATIFADNDISTGAYVVAVPPKIDNHDDGNVRKIKGFIPAEKQLLSVEELLPNTFQNTVLTALQNYMSHQNYNQRYLCVCVFFFKRCDLLTLFF